MKYEDLTREILKSIKALGWIMEKSDNPTSKNTPRLIQTKLQVNCLINIIFEWFRKYKIT
jgi:hypothetical protein